MCGFQRLVLILFISLAGGAAGIRSDGSCGQMLFSHGTVTSLHGFFINYLCGNGSTVKPLTETTHMRDHPFRTTWLELRIYMNRPLSKDHPCFETAFFVDFCGGRSSGVLLFLLRGDSAVFD